MRKRLFAIVLALVLVLGLVPGAAFAAEAPRDLSFELAEAEDLKELGLFRGSGTNADGSTNFDLERIPTRLEAVVMLIRLLGKDAEAGAFTEPCPFSDVPEWGRAYIAYAYANGLTNGISATQFGMSNSDASMFRTLVLRALGYDDAAGDFAWNDNVALSRKLGLLPTGLRTDSFLRADMVTMSYAAMYAYVKGGAETLSQRMIREGVFTAAQFSAAMDKSLLSAQSGRSNFTNGYTSKTGFVSEKPEDIFDEPYCYYRGSGANQGIEIWGEKNIVAKLPMMAELGAELLVLNKSSRDIFLEGESAVMSGGMSELTSAASHIFHPNPLWLRLKPGETSRATLAVEFQNKLHDLRENQKGSFIIELGFKGSSETKSSYDRLDSFKLKLPVEVEAYTQNYLNAAANKTAEISGYVKTASGAPLQNAMVTISPGFAEDVKLYTNAQGYYSAKVFPCYLPFLNNYKEYVITVSKDGYANQSAVVYPQEGKTASASFALQKASKKLDYKLVNKLDLGIQAYSFDASDNGETIAFIPFHSALPASQIAGKTKLTLVSKSGELLSQISLPGETPYVHVSGDGEYVTTVQDFNGEGTPSIFNRKGELVYSRAIFPDIDALGAPMHHGSGEGTIGCRCTALSPDNKLFAVGSMDGVFYLIDWKTDTILWDAYMNNQIRTIDFSKNGELLYISSGDGHMYCFDKAGDLKWKSYIGSWATGVAVGEKYLAVTTKNSFHTLALLDAKTGEQLWCKDMAARGSGVVMSPDEACIWWGNDTTGASSALTGVVLNTADGSIRYLVDRGGKMGYFSSDGKYLASKTTNTVSIYDAKTGEQLFHQEVIPSDAPNAYSGNFSLYLSQDAEYLIACFNGNPSMQSCGTAYCYKRAN